MLYMRCNISVIARQHFFSTTTTTTTAAPIKSFRIMNAAEQKGKVHVVMRAHPRRKCLQIVVKFVDKDASVRNGGKLTRTCEHWTNEGFIRSELDHTVHDVAEDQILKQQKSYRLLCCRYLQ